MHETAVSQWEYTKIIISYLNNFKILFINSYNIYRFLKNTNVQIFSLGLKIGQRLIITLYTL